MRQQNNKIIVIGNDDKLLTTATIKFKNNETGEIFHYQFENRATLNNIKPGEYTVEVNAENYIKQSRTIIINRSGCLEYFFMTSDSSRAIGKRTILPINIINNYIGFYHNPSKGVSLDEIKAWVIGLGMNKIDLISEITPDFMAFSFNEGLSDLEKLNIWKTLIQRNDVINAGTIITTTQQNLALLTNKIDIFFINGTNNNDIYSLFNQLNINTFRKIKNKAIHYEIEINIFPNERILDICDEIAKFQFVESVLPIIISKSKKFSINLPTDLLLPLNWHLNIINASSAWEALNNNNIPGYTPGNDITFGSSSIKIAINDTGIESASGAAISQDLNGTLLRNEGGVDVSINKISEFYDFINLVKNNDYVDPIDETAFHGTAVAAICCGNITHNLNDTISGVVGVAPNVQILASINPIQGNHIKSFRWLAGFEDSDYDPIILNNGAQIITNSWGPNNSLISAIETYRVSIKFIVKYGRGGLGTIVLFASGNNKPKEIIDIANPYANINEVITVGASSLFKGANDVLLEKLSSYSCYGDAIDVVAPSNDDYEHWRTDNYKHQAFIHQPNDHFSIIAPSLHGEGYMPGILDDNGTSTIFCVLAQTFTPQPSVPGSYDTSVIIVQDNGTGLDIENTFIPGKSVLIGDLSSNPSKIEGRLIKNINQNSSNSSWWDIELETEYKLSPGNSYKLHYGLKHEHLQGTHVYIGNPDYIAHMSGTSSSCPQVAGIAALVLSANPKLSWLEVKDIIQQSSVKINIEESDSNGLWMDKWNCNILDFSSTPKINNQIAEGIIISDVDIEATSIEFCLTNGTTNDILKNSAISITNGTTTEFRAIQKIEFINSTDLRVFILPICNFYSSGSQIKIGKQAHFSQFYGFGRVDAAAAVQAAIDYQHDWRDLMIRDYLEDEGVLYTDVNINPVQSPDIWISHNNVKPIVDYNVVGPHENPKIDSDRYIFSRIKNRGNGGPDGTIKNLHAYVRFYIALSNGTPASGIATPFKFPDNWSDEVSIDNILTSQINTYFIGEEEILEGELSPGEEKIISIKWDQNLLPSSVNPEDTPRIFLLSHIAPFDGVIIGEGVEHCNNISYREIVFAEFKFCMNNNTESLIRNIEVDSLGSFTNQNFNIEVKSLYGKFLAENVIIELIRTKDDQTEEITTFKNNGSSWETSHSGSSCGNIEPPLESGLRTSVNFTGELSVSNIHSHIEIRVTINNSLNPSSPIYPVASDSYKISIFEPDQLPVGNPSSPELVAKSHVFADMASLVQTNVLAFGPNPGDPINKFRITSSFTSNYDVNAYAIVRGVLMVQPSSTPDKVNLVLRPLDQAIYGFTPVKYFIYRGLRLEDFVEPSDLTKVRSKTSASEFIQEIWAIHEDQNTEPSGYTLPFLSESFGYANQPTTDSLDMYFFQTNPDKQLPIVTKGMNIGRFYTADSEEFGLDIILEEGDFQTDLEYVRKAFYEIDLTGMSDSTDEQKFLKRIKKEEILNFMDPAAFYGMHFSGKVESSGSSTPYSEELIYTEVVEKFFTKNKLYIDIRNENCNSYNFFKNYHGPVLDPDYGKNIQIRNQSSSTIHTLNYGTNNIALYDWPILIIDETVNTSLEEIETYIKLRIDDNTKPILYANTGTIITPSEKEKFVRNDNLIDTALLNWTKEVGISTPAIGNSGNKRNIAWVIKLFYERQIDSLTIWPNTVVSTKHFTDNVFGPIDKQIIWDTTKPTRWLTIQDKKFIDGSLSSFGFSYIANRGVAFETERVIFYSQAIDILEIDGDYSAIKSIPSGLDSQGDFLDVSYVFDGKQIMFNSIFDVTTGEQILLLNLVSSNIFPVKIEDSLFLGITKDQYLELQSLSGLSSDYQRTIILEEESAGVGTVFIDTNGKQYYKFKLGIQGLKSDGTYDKIFPTFANNILVYSLDELFYVSKEFSAIQNVEEYKPTIEEEIGINNPEPKSIIAGDSTMETYMNDFINQINSIPVDVNSKSSIESLIQQFALDIFSHACSYANTSLDDRPLYWARLFMILEIRKHPYCRMNNLDRNEFVKLFDSISRGYDGIDFSSVSTGTKKVLITGFDPFQLHRVFKNAGYDGPNTSNPSGVAALNLHGKTLFDGEGNSCFIQSAVFPVRYRDFDDRIVESVVEGFLQNNSINMIISMSLNGSAYYFDIERFAGKFRGGTCDNEYIGSASLTYKYPSYTPLCRELFKQMQDVEPGNEFYETNLPIDQILTDTLSSGFNLDFQKIFFDQSYNPDSGGRKHISKMNSEPNMNITYFSLNPNTRSVEGSGGAYLSNEVMYRISRAREEYNSSVKTGHLHLPNISKPENVPSTVIKYTLSEAIEDIKTMIINSIKSI